MDYGNEYFDETETVDSRATKTSQSTNRTVQYTGGEKEVKEEKKSYEKGYGKQKQGGKFQ